MRVTGYGKDQYRTTWSDSRDSFGIRKVRAHLQRKQRWMEMDLYEAWDAAIDERQRGRTTIDLRNCT